MNCKWGVLESSANDWTVSNRMKHNLIRQQTAMSYVKKNVLVDLSSFRNVYAVIQKILKKNVYNDVRFHVLYQILMMILMMVPTFFKINSWEKSGSLNISLIANLIRKKLSLVW